MVRNADRTVRIAENADETVTVVADQVLTATPTDVGKVVTVDGAGELILGDPGAAAHPGLASHDDLGLATQEELDAHVAGADPHTGYQRESEKGAANGYAGLDAGTKVPTAQLGGAGADNARFLRGDQTWAVPAGGGGGDPAMGGDLSGTASNAQIVPGAVGTTELANGAVTAAKVAADVATQAELDAHAAGAHGGGAPTGASYIVVASDPTLTDERVLSTAVHMRGTLAARTGALAAAVPGAYYTTTDDIRATYRSNGSGWDQIAPGLLEGALWTVAKAGTAIGTRRRINLIEGSNVTITAADDAPNDEVAPAASTWSTRPCRPMLPRPKCTT